MKELIKKCPKCDEYLVISEYSCPECDTKIKGEFKISESTDDNHNIFSKLNEEDRYFALVFLQTGGVIQNVEKVMGISYPTVKAKLKEIQAKLSGEIHDWHHDKSFDKKEFKREMKNFKRNLKRHIKSQIHHSMRDGFGVKVDLKMDPDDDHDSFESERHNVGAESSSHQYEMPESELGKSSKKEASDKMKRVNELLDQLDSGELDADETMNKIKDLK